MHRKNSMKTRILLGLFFFLAIASAVRASDTALTFGLFPYVSRGQLMDYHTPLKVYLETQLKQPVDLITAPDFAEFMARTQKGEYDLVLTAPHMARLAEKRDNYARIAMTGHQVTGIFLARRDSGIRTMADLKGKSIMIAQPISIIHQMSIAHLERNGLIPGKDVTVVGTRTHNNALYAPARHETDASVTGVLLWENADPKLREEMIDFSRTESAPGFMLMANKRLPASKIRHLQSLLLGFANTAEGKAYFQATDLVGFDKIDDKTMKALDPYTRILVEQTP